MLNDSEKLRILEQLLYDVSCREACYPDSGIADEIISDFRAKAGDVAFASVDPSVSLKNVENTTPNIFYLPSHDFVSTTVASFNGSLLECSRLWTDSRMDDPVLASTRLADCDWATLFAYMHRRFGLPHLGGDEVKDLSAKWVLSTPDPEVFVVVSPSLSGPAFSFSPYLAFQDQSNNKARHIQLEDREFSADRISSIAQAYKATLLDLLRPVSVRDNLINALGELGDDELSIALQDHDDEDDEDENHLSFKAARHPSSGFSMPLGLFGGQEWVTLCQIINRLSDGDIVTGRRRAIKILQDQIFSVAGEDKGTVQRLMLWGAGANYDAVVDGLGLMEADTTLFDEQKKALFSSENPDRTLVAEISDSDLEKASKYLDDLGIGSKSLRSTIKKLRRECAVSTSWSELTVIGDGKFPDNISFPSHPYSDLAELPSKLERAFSLAGHDVYCEWVRRTAALPEGLLALADISLHLSLLAKKDLGED